jgi:hypothetical protein
MLYEESVVNTQWHERKHQRTRLPNEIRASQASHFWNPPLVKMWVNQLNKSKIIQGVWIYQYKIAYVSRISTDQMWVHWPCRDPCDVWRRNARASIVVSWWSVSEHIAFVLSWCA